MESVSSRDLDIIAVKIEAYLPSYHHHLDCVTSGTCSKSRIRSASSSASMAASSPSTSVSSLPSSFVTTSSTPLSTIASGLALSQRHACLLNTRVATEQACLLIQDASFHIASQSAFWSVRSCHISCLAFRHLKGERGDDGGGEGKAF